nr:hypothetical protein [Tanacetum cinerariifolium]GEZ33260.1 hypothetical protein [Tanacetum cinerariifolium]GEZ35619.1 hypothetical protein [Tanacetum cinerariifolium]
MDSSTSFQANQPYSSLNRVNLDMDFDQLLYSQEYYSSQDYSMSQSSAHGSAPGDDDYPVEEMSPVKAKKPSRRASKAKEKEPPKDWTTAEEIALCEAWCNVLENSERGNSMKTKGFLEAVIKYFKNKTGSTRGHDFTLEYCYNILKDHQGWLEIKMPAFYKNTEGVISLRLLKPPWGQHLVNLNNESDESEEEIQEKQAMGHDRAKAKKKSSDSSREGSSLFVDLVADKFLNMKRKNGERGRSNNSPISSEESGVGYPGDGASKSYRVEKRELAIQRQTLELAEREKRDRDILFYNSKISFFFPVIQRQKPRGKLHRSSLWFALTATFRSLTEKNALSVLKWETFSVVGLSL